MTPDMPHDLRVPLSSVMAHFPAHPSPAQTTLATVVRTIATALEQAYGLDPLPVLRSAGIDPGIMDDAGTRLPVSTLSPLWLRCVEVTGDPDFGIRAVRYHHPANLYGVDLALYACATLSEAVNRHVQLVGVMSTVAHPSLTQDAAGDWRMEFRLSGERTPTTVAKDFYWHFHVRMFERLTGQPASHFLRRIELVRETPGDRTAWDALGIPVLFEQSASALLFRADRWQSPLPGCNPRLLAQVERPILQYLAQHGLPLPLSALRARLAECPLANPDIDDLSDSLDIPREHLLRTLHQHDLKFAQLLDQTREAKALQLLRDPQLSIEQIAERAGFSSTSSLVRAFRRWRGVTPLAYRKQHLGQGQ